MVRWVGLFLALGVARLGAQSAGASSAIPDAYRPPPGMCRIWIDGVPPDRQPAPTDCATAVRRRPANAKVVFGDLSTYVAPANAQQSSPPAGMPAATPVGTPPGTPTGQPAAPAGGPPGTQQPSAPPKTDRPQDPQHPESKPAAAPAAPTSPPKADPRLAPLPNHAAPSRPVPAHPATGQPVTPARSFSPPPAPQQAQPAGRPPRGAF